MAPGGCGTGRFWDLALREHAMIDNGAVYDEPLSTFFRNVDTRQSPALNLPVGDGDAYVTAYVDMLRRHGGDLTKNKSAEAANGSVMLLQRRIEQLEGGGSRAGGDEQRPVQTAHNRPEGDRSATSGREVPGRVPRAAGRAGRRRSAAAAAAGAAADGSEGAAA